MPLLYLVRHGETAYNAARRWQGQSDLPLNERGLAQAAAVARRLAGEGLSAIVSSDLLRARQTAAAIASSCALEATSDARLREVDVGSWEGLTAAEAERRDPAGHARWVAGGTGWDDGETYLAMAARTVEAAEDIALAHPAEARIALVMHGGPVRAVVAHAVGLPGDGRRVLAPTRTASISVIRADGHRWSLVAYNDACHLGDVADPLEEPRAARPNDDGPRDLA